METTGGECELGGGDPGGGDTGGGDTGGAPYYYPFKNQISPIGVGGQYQEATTAALKQIDEDLRWTAIKLYGQGEESLATFKDFGRDLRKVTDALTTQINGSEQVGLINNQMLSTLNRSEDWIQELTLCVTRPLDYNCGHLAGSGGGSSSSEDTAAIKGMMQTAMGWWGGTPGNLTSISGQLTGISNSVAPMFPMLEHFNKQQTSLQTQMAGDLAAIKNALESGQGSGGSGNEGGTDIDYSQMPGSGSNPLHVAGSEYNSTLCSGDASCAFDLEQITKKYDEEKEALKSQYLAIKGEMADIFRFDFYGSASVPKCFDMFSLFGNDYQVCPNVGGYWEILLALMLFIFYFIAFMIVAKR
ncbi:hypothetical protein [Aeromonas caviae]|uniref:hypothetical protein n=1 Tax=Aeromonas caviae TaxID=648 RepID=UPI0029D653FF|nr:hypothetical protein [Aeromonas caviae]MDX7871667.1 hypothetical protein [Aeromonas caviae]